MDKKEFIQLNKEIVNNIRGYRYISSGLYEEKKSKFYSYIFKIENKEEAENIINAMREEFKDSRHVVYTYVIDNIYKYSDDGEPSGTAGKMIYSLLEKQNITNSLVVVIRYFGGILLGAGPLSRAYLKAVKSAEENLEIIEYIPKLIYELECDYNEEASLRSIIDKYNIEIIDVKYEDKAKYVIRGSENDIKLLASFKNAK